MEAGGAGRRVVVGEDEFLIALEIEDVRHWAEAKLQAAGEPSRGDG